MTEEQKEALYKFADWCWDNNYIFEPTWDQFKTVKTILDEEYLNEEYMNEV